MANIGNFTRDGDKFTGNIVTLALKTKATIQRIDKPSPQAPDFRIFAAGAEGGAAWVKQGKSERPYLSVKLDDPSFAGAIYCRLIETDGDQHQLLWSR
jgi:uncharacterized protein (DUF736 family)